MPIDFTPTPAQEELRRNSRAFAESVLAPVAEAIQGIADPVESFTRTRDAYRQMAKAGFTKSYVPVADGGLGFGMVDFAIAAEELTRIDVNVPTTLLGTGLGLQPVIAFGTAEQRRRFLTPFVEDADGERLASFAFTEVGGFRKLLHSRRQPHGISLRGIVHAEIIADLPDHNLARVEAHANGEVKRAVRRSSSA